MCEEAKAIIPLLKDFVERNDNIVGIQWDLGLRPRLFVNPYSKDYTEKKKAAHYFLLAASIDESRVIGKAENVRILLDHFYRTFVDDLFKILESWQFKNEAEKCEFYGEFGPEKEAIMSVLASVNKFVRDEAEGDLIRYSQRFSKPKYMVEDLARHIERMGGRFKEKSWMYMRWMVRPKPDLGIFNHFLPEDLFIPLTTDITNVAVSLGLIDKVDPSFFQNENEVALARDKVTQFARQVSPKDPARLDYPLFLLGRWLRGKNLNRQVLMESLRLFDQVYRKTGYACVQYQIISRYKSHLEENVAKTLREMDVSYEYERARFPLAKHIFYTPDFLLRKLRVKGKKVILEPHGIWQKREAHKFLERMRVFRQTYGSDYFLILVVPNYRVKSVPPEAYDAIWSIDFFPQELYQLKYLREGY